MKININVGDKILAASLADNATARDFVSWARLSKCGQSGERAHCASGPLVTLFPDRTNKADVLGICPRAIALASSMQDWRERLMGSLFPARLASLSRGSVI